MQNWKTKLTRRLLVAVVAVVTVATLATYEFTKPARAAVSAPAAAPLDDNSVAALLTLDRAMETLSGPGYSRGRERDRDVEAERAAGRR